MFSFSFGVRRNGVFMLDLVLMSGVNFELYALIKESELFSALVASKSIGICAHRGGTQMKLFEHGAGCGIVFWS